MKYNSRNTQALINLYALKQNYLNISKLAIKSKTIAVIKANAYGHGSLGIAKALHDDVPAVAIAFIEEALALRDSGITLPILILEGPLKESDIEMAKKNNFWLMFHSHYQTNWLLKKENLNIENIWLKIDTGMNRLGFKPNEIDAIITKLNRKQKTSLILCSHLSNAEELSNKKTIQQLDILKRLGTFYGCKYSLANSAGILNWPECHADFNRLGLALYGIPPIKKTVLNPSLIPVMTLQSSIIALHHLNIGDTVGYGGAWQAKCPSVIATIAIGYADGYPRHAKTGTPVWIKKQIAPLAGRVSMDMITVDVTNIADISIGDIVELWGENIAVDTVAECADTISYELLTRVSERVPKVYTCSESR